MRIMFFFFLFFLAFPIEAQILCRVDVSYQWRRSESEEDLLKVHMASLQAEGEDEASAKARLEALLTEEKAKAYEICRLRHENLSGCIASKAVASSSVLQSAGFSARRALEEAIISDCRASSGQCRETISTEPVCSESVSESEGASGGKADSKDQKGGKK